MIKMMSKLPHSDVVKVAGAIEPALQMSGVYAAVRPAVVGVLEDLVMPQQPARRRGDVGSEQRGRDVAM